MSKMAANGLLGFCNAYHAYPSAWIKSASGQLVYGSIQPEIRTALLSLQELYADGCLAKDFATKTSDQAYEAVQANKCGVVIDTAFVPGYLQKAWENDHNIEWKHFPLPSIDDKPALVQHELGVSEYWVVNKKCQHPEVMIQLMNVWMRNFYDNRDPAVAKVFNANNGISYWYDALVQVYKPFANADFTSSISAALKGETTIDSLLPNGQIVANAILAFRKDGSHPETWYYPLIYGEEGSGWTLIYYKNNNQYEMNQFYGSPTPTMVARLADLQAKEEEVFTEIIMGSSIEKFDAFVSDWGQLGGDQITKEVNDWYATQK
jgi:putative aldouronate transport system substrate-binding protein